MESNPSQSCALEQSSQLDLAKVTREYSALVERHEKLERVCAGHKVPWAEMRELSSKTAETVRLEVKREMELRERKVIEILIKQQLEEK